MSDTQNEVVRDFLLMTKMGQPNDINKTEAIQGQLKALTVSQVKEFLEEELKDWKARGGKPEVGYKVSNWAGSALRTHYMGGPTLAFEHTGVGDWDREMYKPFAEIIALTQQVRLEWIPESQGQA